MVILQRSVQKSIKKQRRIWLEAQLIHQQQQAEKLQPESDIHSLDAATIRQRRLVQCAHELVFPVLLARGQRAFRF